MQLGKARPCFEYDAPGGFEASNMNEMVECPQWITLDLDQMALVVRRGGLSCENEILLGGIMAWAQHKEDTLQETLSRLRELHVKLKRTHAAA